MPTITLMNYGYDSAGIQNYLNEIKSIVLVEAVAAVKDISKIKNSCNQVWEGQAKDDFFINLQKDANHVAEQYDHLYNALISEIESIENAMATKDKSMIVKD